MAAKVKMNKTVIKAGFKRVNLKLSIAEYDKLSIYAEAKNIPATTAAKSLLMPIIEKEVETLLKKEKYVPKAARGISVL
jgi:hypothetical protein